MFVISTIQIVKRSPPSRASSAVPTPPSFPSRPSFPRSNLYLRVLPSHARPNRKLLPRWRPIWRPAISMVPIATPPGPGYLETVPIVPTQFQPMAEPEMSDALKKSNRIRGSDEYSVSFVRDIVSGGCAEQVFMISPHSVGLAWRMQSCSSRCAGPLAVGHAACPDRLWPRSLINVVGPFTSAVPIVPS